MIRKIFLGKPWHWAILIVAAGLLWYCGSKRLHVIEFNWFIIAMLIGTAVSVFAVIWFYREGEQVTRDALVVHDVVSDADNKVPPIRD